MRLLHCADVHLDAAFAGLGAAVADRRRAALRSSLRRIVDVALEEKVDALTVGGDLFEDELARPDTVHFLQEQFGRLACPVLLAPGNHDYFHPGSLYARGGWPQNVVIFVAPQFSLVEVEGIRVFGAGHVQPKGTADLLQGFKVPKGPDAVALFHGAQRLGRLGGDQDDYAPFSEDRIAKAGFRYLLTGHYHAPRQTPRLIYPGNPEPLSFGETGERGAALIDCASWPPRVEVRKVATYTLSDAEVDISDCSHSEAVLEKVNQAVPSGADTGARVTVTGDLAPSVDITPGQLLSRLREGDRCVELVFQARPAFDLESLRQAPDASGQFVRSLMARPDFDSELVQAALATGLGALRGESPRLL